MPPRDDPPASLRVSVESSPSSSSSSVSSSSSFVSVEKLLKDSKAAADRHNVPSEITSGWRRKTFHWELNVYSALFVFFLYRAIPERFRFLFHLLGLLVCFDAASYYYQKQDLPGVPYTLPFVSLIAMIVSPVRFWAELACIAIESGTGCCTNAFGGKFMIFCTDTSICRQVMTGEGTFQIFAHPNALWLFGSKNLIYMDTEAPVAELAIALLHCAWLLSLH